MMKNSGKEKKKTETKEKSKKIVRNDAAEVKEFLYKKKKNYEEVKYK